MIGRIGLVIPKRQWENPDRPSARGRAVIANPNGIGIDNCPTDISSGRWRCGFVAVLLMTAILYFARLGERALWSEEVRWAEIPRNMAASGDFFWPAINGHTYYDKPLGSYWLVLAAAWLVGDVNEAAARLPSAFCGLLAVAVVMLIGRSLYGCRASLIAGAVLATSFGFVVFSRTAAADIENVAGVLIALWLCLRNEGRGGGWWVVGLWLVMAVTSLTKGLLGFALPLLVFGVYRLFAADVVETNRGWLMRFIDRQRWFLNRVTPLAILGAILLYAAPFAFSMEQSGASDGLSMVWRENIQRFFDAHNHRGPIYLYTYVLFGLAAPWCALLPAALVQAHVQRNRDDRFALAYFWATFLFFTLSSSRRSYYLLPILPAVALLIGGLLASPLTQLTAWSRRLLTCGFWLAMATAPATVVMVMLPHSVLPSPWDQLPPLPAPGAFCAIVLITGVPAALAIWRWNKTNIALAFAALAFGSLGYLFLFAQPDLERYRTEQPYLATVCEQVGEDVSGLVLFRTREAVFYLAPQTPLPEAGTPAELRSLVESGSACWVLARERDLPNVSFVGPVVSRQPIQAWEGAEVRASKLVLVRVRR